MNEIWKRIENHSRYLISSEGRIFSLKSNKFLKHQFSPRGYPRVKLDGKTIPIHRLLGIHFIPNPDNHFHVLHKDDDKSNYSLDNLYWGNDSMNVKDCWDNGIKKRKIFSFTLTTGEEISTDNLSLWCEERGIPFRRVQGSIRKGNPVNPTPGNVYNWKRKSL